MWPTVSEQTAAEWTASLDPSLGNFIDCASKATDTQESTAALKLYLQRLKLQAQALEEDINEVKVQQETVNGDISRLEAISSELEVKYNDIKEQYGDKRKIDELAAMFDSTQRVEYNGKTIIACLKLSVAEEDELITSTEAKIQEKKDSIVAKQEILNQRKQHFVDLLNTAKSIRSEISPDTDEDVKMADSIE